MISSPRNRPAYKLPENIEAELILYDIVVDTFNKYFGVRLSIRQEKNMLLVIKPCLMVKIYVSHMKCLKLK